MTIKPCEQNLCTLKINGQCPECKSCGAQPNKVEENCEICWCCTHDAGYVRGNNKSKVDEKIKVALVNKLAEEIIEVMKE